MQTPTHLSFAPTRRRGCNPAPLRPIPSRPTLLRRARPPPSLRRENLEETGPARERGRVRLGGAAGEQARVRRRKTRGGTRRETGRRSLRPARPAASSSPICLGGGGCARTGSNREGGGDSPSPPRRPERPRPPVPASGASAAASKGLQVAGRRGAGRARRRRRESGAATDSDSGTDSASAP